MGDGSVRDVIHWPEIVVAGRLPQGARGKPDPLPLLRPLVRQGRRRVLARRARAMRRPMPMHGFARQGEFRATRVDAGGFEAVFVPGDEARASYPFRIRVPGRLPLLRVRAHVQPHAREPRGRAAAVERGAPLLLQAPLERGVDARRLPDPDPGRRRACARTPAGQLVAGPRLAPNERMDNPALIDTFHTALSGPEAVFGEKGPPGRRDDPPRGRRPSRPRAPPSSPGPRRDDSPFYCVEPWMGPAERARAQDRPAPRPPGRPGDLHGERRRGIGLRLPAFPLRSKTPRIP